MKTYAVIMAGGSGERFWPASRIAKPKQLLKLISANKTMIEEAIDRIAPVIPHERILIITSETLRHPIIDALPLLPSENVIAEPAKRNTAPCLALAAQIIKQHAAEQNETDAVMAVLTADHFIGDAQAFQTDVKKAVEVATSSETLVTIGVRPNRPETGYGYIEVESVGTEPVHVSSFREKPDAATAMQYVTGGKHLWNSGMFFWRVSVLEKEMSKALPEVGKIIAMSDVDADTYKSLPDISIDFGVMEKASSVHVVPASFPWDDVGSWDAMDRLHEHASAENVSMGKTELIDTTSSIVINTIDKGHVVATLGVDNVVVVVTKDATMVCDKSRAQDVKKIVGAIREKGWTDLL